MYQPSGPPQEMAFGLTEASNVEQINFNPVLENGLQLQQIGGYNDAQTGECSPSRTVLEGWQSDYMGLKNGCPFITDNVD